MLERKHIEAIDIAQDRIRSASTISGLEDLHSAIDAALAACDESPWRSMESAPYGGSPVWVSFWYKYSTIKGGDKRDRMQAEASFREGAWRLFDTDRSADGESGTIVEPTHWMPLPAAPEVKP